MEHTFERSMFLSVAVAILTALTWLAFREDGRGPPLSIIAVLAVIILGVSMHVATHSTHPWLNLLVGTASGLTLLGLGQLLGGGGVQGLAPLVALGVFGAFRKPVPQTPVDPRILLHMGQLPAAMDELSDLERVLDIICKASELTEGLRTEMERQGITDEQSWESLANVDRKSAELLRAVKAVSATVGPEGKARKYSEIQELSQELRQAIEELEVEQLATPPRGDGSA